MRYNVDFDLKIDNINKFNEYLRMFCKDISETDDYVFSYINSVETIVEELKQKKGRIFKEKSESHIERLNLFMESVQCVFNIKKFFGVCQFIVDNGQNKEAVYILERGFISAISEFDLFLYINSECIAETLLLIEKTFLMTEITGKLATREYSIMSETGERENLLPAFYFFATDVDAKKEIEKNAFNDETISLSQDDNCSTSKFSLRLIDNCSPKYKSFLEFLNTIETKGLQNPLFDSTNKIEKWDENCNEISTFLTKEEGVVFEDISNELLRKLMNEGKIEKILDAHDITDFDFVIQLMQQNSINWYNESAEILSIVDLDFVPNDTEIETLKFSGQVQESGYRLSKRILPICYKNSGIIRNPKVLLKRPYLFKYLPNKMGDKLIKIYLYRNNNSPITNNVLEQIKYFIMENIEFFGKLYACSNSFFVFLKSEFNLSIESARDKERLQKYLKSICETCGIKTLVNLSAWIGENEITTLRENKNPKILSIKESRDYKYIADGTEGYTSDKPILFTRAPIVFVENNGVQEMICSEFHVTEYLTRHDLIIANAFSDGERSVIEHMLDEKFIDLEDDDFEKYVIESDVLEIFSTLYKKTELRGRCFDFIIKIVFDNRNYRLVYTFENQSVECEENVIFTESRDKDGLYENRTLGLSKGSKVIHKPKCNFYKFDFAVLAKKFIELIDEVAKPIKTNEQTSLIKTLIKSLINNSRLIENEAWESLNTQKKKDWVLRNDTISFLFESEPQEHLSEFSDMIGKDAIFANKVDVLEQCGKYFIDEWNHCLTTLNKHGISRIKIVPHTTIVTDENLSKGWKVRNEKKEYTSNLNDDRLVYEIIQQGIEADGTIVREPIVNAYSHKED